MAKTFKSLSSSESTARPKPVSERDFFDLTDDPHQPIISEVIPLINQNTDVIGNTGANSVTSNVNVADNTGITKEAGNTTNLAADNSLNRSNSSRVGITGNTVLSEIPDGEASSVADKNVRQTFVLSKGQLEQLRDYVHAQRAGGDYNYSQK